jgi:hypothetical protein
MHDYNIIFDLESKKIGFKKARCVYPDKKARIAGNEEMLSVKSDLGKYFNKFIENTYRERFYFVLILILCFISIVFILVFTITYCRFDRENLMDASSKEKCIQV